MPTRFVLPGSAGSPPKILTFDEVRDAIKNVEDMQLAHEIAINPDFRLQPYDPPETSLEKRIKAIMHDAFWDLLRNQLNADPPQYDHAIALLGDIKEVQVTLKQFARDWSTYGEYSEEERQQCYVSIINEIEKLYSADKVCDAKTFQLSKSHKKILKKMNSFLRTGHKSSGGDNRSIKSDGDNDVQNDHNDCDMKVDNEQPTEVTESSALAESKMITSNQPKVQIDIDNVLDIIEKAENGPKIDATIATTSNMNEALQISDTGMCSNKKLNNESNKRGLVAGPDPTKPLQPKAKLLRQQRKAEKQQAKANTMSTDVNGATTAETPSTSGKLPKNTQKDLKSLIDEIPTDGAHKLKVKLVPSHSASTEVALNLYRRYQIGIHKDPPEKITRKSFENFLVRTPLQVILVNVESDEFKRNQNTEFAMYTKYQIRIHRDPPSDLSEFLDFLCNSPIKHETPDDGPTCGYGSFHQQYWLDDILVAVGVIDILPKCVSSVYFFYDPDYSFLTLGTYGTLREVQFVKDLNESAAGLSEYYMGFYIHSCPKMRYKGKLQPSYLLCPEIYTWHLINDDILKLLDESKYSRFNLDPQARDLNEFNPAIDINHLRLLVDYKYCLTYRDYKEYKGTEGTDSDEDDFDNFSEYGKLVGNVLSRRLYLVT